MAIKNHNILRRLCKNHHKNQIFLILKKNNKNPKKNMSQNIKVCIRMRPLLQHEDVEFWQTDETENTITTANFYSDPNELLSESYNNLSITNKLIVGIVLGGLHQRRLTLMTSHEKRSNA